MHMLIMHKSDNALALGDLDGVFRDMMDREPTQAAYIPRDPWPSVFPDKVILPAQWRGCFRPSKSSPWQIPVLTSPKYAKSAPPPRQTKRVPNVADQLDGRAAAMKKAALVKMRCMAAQNTLEWFNLSSNKESDKRGSRASILVEGLRRPGGDSASTDLHTMTQIARDYFQDLHTPENNTPDRKAEQLRLLQEVRLAYGEIPAPLDVPVGPFLEEEVRALTTKMPNTAPGPDSLPYGFWKSLARRLTALADRPNPPRDFWCAFRDLTDDLRARGTSRLRFKDANVSLFYKKGDPTLVANYRPILSMNTDCKMFTNLVNTRLAPWVVAKLHTNQKGFVPGRHIFEHTRLASEVAHLCDSSGTPGFIVGLDQAKAYNRVDQAWLMDVLEVMGILADVLGLVENVLPKCRLHMRINSGYSTRFSLRRGMRQGDPLSCLLFNFSIKPLAMRLQGVVSGISIHGLPPAHVMLYVDDINLFLSLQDSVTDIASCLTITSFAIGSKFNLEKTDVKPVSTAGFVQRCFDAQDMDGSTLPGAYILPPSDPLRVLGVWIGDEACATPQWKQIDQHISQLIRQWSAIGASLRNCSLLAKAFMQSRCYHLLDGNGIPAPLLNKLSRKISRFV